MSSNTINPKPCNYGCNTRIYWNTSENAYFEVFSGNRHQCPNRQQQHSNYNNKKATSSIPSPSQTTTVKNKPSSYSTNKKSWFKIPNPIMSNSLELLQGSIVDVQRKYEILSDMVSEANGKVHDSQSHIVTAAAP
ncbi:MAG TPA: hypothetical protein VLA74_02595, partial [Nitrososphaeraceae archaeon]|nr:hypothetical protein [Nitrososphaeraceae archaeon]